MTEVIARYEDNGYGNVAGEIVGELIRCKDCKFFIMAENKYHEDDFEPYPACELFYDNWGEMPIEVSENDFCSHAERRKE